VVACDTESARIELVKENCARLGVTCAEAISIDDLDPRRWSFDRVLVDAPCSNTGVMRRRVDLRWRIRPEEIARLQVTQLGLLQRAASLVRTGGTVVYSTCSLEPEENRQVVQRFLVERPGFSLAAERELLPFVDQVDGAYVAALTRMT
jgi:16S rRNA (cytosine967-C5)-methyltransferase